MIILRNIKKTLGFRVIRLIFLDLVILTIACLVLLYSYGLI